ncbi:TetR/AcrR family transcriptional regulator [Nocardia sp. NPDC051570]|uniref:TetR/AcrR family transcriptional regulator n=1 Tax=Nocardia sp. NPDC051570 TaxID=3364324 RepID=UPI0037B2236D
MPSGPHKLTREQVADSQRSRILWAALDVVGRQGYPNTSIGDIAAQARVSRTAIYALFADKEQCFLAACEEFGNDVLANVVEIAVAAPTPLAALSGVTDMLIELMRREPVAARAWLLELYAAGSAGLELRLVFVRKLETQFDALAAHVRRLDPSLPTLPAFAGRGVAAAMFELWFQALDSQDDKTLQELRATAVHVWLVGLTGQEHISRLL